jgi:hypothetical protein
MNFRTHQHKDQENLLVKQRTIHSSDTGVGTFDDRCHECSNTRGIYGEKVG